MPLVFILMSDRDTKSHARMLIELNQVRPGLIRRRSRPTSKMLHFLHFVASIQQINNRAAFSISASASVHIAKWRKVQHVTGLAKRYTADPDFPLQICHLLALAFVSTNDVFAAFQELTYSAFFVENSDELQDLVNYSEDT